MNIRSTTTTTTTTIRHPQTHTHTHTHGVLTPAQIRTRKPEYQCEQITINKQTHKNKKQEIQNTAPTDRYT